MCRELKFKVGSPQPASRPDLAVRQLPINQQAAHSLCCSWDDRGIHTSMLSGLLSMMGMQVVREPKASDFAGLKGAAKAKAIKRAQKMAKNDYQGARGTHFALFPASAVAKSTPQWVMSTELVETSRLWARYSAAINPAWAEPLAGQLTRTTYAEPHWSGSRGSAVATAKVLLYGLPIIADRTVQWGRINPMEARDFLIRQGLVEGDVQQRFSYDDFLARNRDILDEAAEDASRTRQVSQSVSDEDLYDFYQSVIPNDVTCVANLAKWWKREHGEHPHLLDFDPDKVERLSSAESVSLADYPDHWHALGTDGQPIDLRLSYIYDPHDPADGVTVHVPLKALSRLTPEQFTWNVPGLLDELIVGADQVPAEITARAVRARTGHRAQDPRMDRRPVSGPARHRHIRRPGPRMARPAARVHPGGDRHRGRSDPPGGADRRTMGEAARLPADDVLHRAATPRAAQRTRTAACTRPGEGTGFWQIPDRVATAVRRTGGGIRPAHGRTQGGTGRQPGQTGRTGQPAAQGRGDERVARGDGCGGAPWTRCACLRSVSRLGGSAPRR